jgi:hypothetical protein
MPAPRLVGMAAQDPIGGKNGRESGSPVEAASAQFNVCAGLVILLCFGCLGNLKKRVRCILGVLDLNGCKCPSILY